MKKTILYLLLGSITLTNPACKKNTATVSDVNEIVNVTINVNESYKYALPASADPAAYTIESVAAKSAIVDIENDSNSSSLVYTPPQDFSGTDVVVISSTTGLQVTGEACDRTSQTKNGVRCKRRQGRKGKKYREAKTKHNITFNITVTGIQN